MALIRRITGRLLCRAGRHKLIVETAKALGLAAVIPHCARPGCRHVQIEKVTTTVWNRAARRRGRRALPRALRKR